MEPVYTVEETAEMLKLSIFTVREYLKRGKLHGVKIGKSWRIHQRSISALIEGSTDQTGSKD